MKKPRLIFNEMLGRWPRRITIGDMLVLLAEKGETEEEIAAAANAMLDRAIPIAHTFTTLLDTCGTGGDESGSFNISTASAIVCSLFVPVAKHGNRAVSSKSGSADVLEAFGHPHRPGYRGRACFLEEKNFVFLFAQKFFPAMKFVTGRGKKSANERSSTFWALCATPPGPTAR